MERNALRKEEGEILFKILQIIKILNLIIKKIGEKSFEKLKERIYECFFIFLIISSVESHERALGLLLIVNKSNSWRRYDRFFEIFIIRFLILGSSPTRVLMICVHAGLIQYVHISKFAKSF